MLQTLSLTYALSCEIITFIMWKSNTVAFKYHIAYVLTKSQNVYAFGCHEIYFQHITNCILRTLHTQSCKYYIAYVLTNSQNVWAFGSCVTNSIFNLSRTVSYEHYTLNHVNITSRTSFLNLRMYALLARVSRTLSLEYHTIYHVQ